MTGARWLPGMPIQPPPTGTGIAWLSPPPIRRSDAGRCAEISFTARGICGTTIPIRTLLAVITGTCSQLRRLFFSLARIAFECELEGVHAATTTGRETLLVAIASRNPLLATAILLLVPVLVMADFAVATGIAVVVCGPGWLLPFGVVDATVSTTPFAV